MTTVGLSLCAPTELEKRNQPMDLCWLASTAVTSVRRRCAHVRGPKPSPAKLLIVITMLRVACSMSMRFRCYVCFWPCGWILLEMQQGIEAPMCICWFQGTPCQVWQQHAAVSRCSKSRGKKGTKKQATCTCTPSSLLMVGTWSVD